MRDTQVRVTRGRVASNSSTQPVQLSFGFDRTCSSCGTIKPLEGFTPDPKALGGYRGTCLVCNRDQAKLRNRRMRAESSTRVNGLRKVCRETNAEHYRETARAWREKNRDKLNERQRAAYRQNPQKKYERDREYRLANPDLFKARIHARRAREATYSRESVAFMGILRGDPCCYCGVLGESSTVDHITALVGGGTNEWSNLTSACRSCNSSKNAADVLSFLLRRAA